MNFWALISTIIFTWQLTAPAVYHLPILKLQDKNQVLVSGQVFDAQQTKIPHKVDNNSLGVKLTAQAAAVMDKNTGTVLWQKNADEVRSLASITKLMTALVFLDNNPGWDQTLTMAKEDETGANSTNIFRDETVSIKDAFYTMLIASDNDVARALVRSTDLKSEEFVKLMNDKAKVLGLNQTSFVDPTGLSAKNVSSANDILILAKRAFSNPDIKNAASQKAYSFTTLDGKNHKINSTNHLLSGFLDIIAGKTGFIPDSGYCLVAEIEGDNDQRIVSVVLGSASNVDRFNDLKILSAWTLNNFVWY